MDGGVASSTNGVSHNGQDGALQDVSQIQQALDAIYDARSSNDTRKAASAYLDRAKRLPEAPSHGYALALDKSHPPALRHYGLSMLEYSVRYAWDDYNDEQAGAIRNYVVQLAQAASERDPVYVRNKIAQLWADTAKRSWGTEWMEMDELLVQLWNTSVVHQGVALYVLETLADQVFNGEDTIANLRGHDLRRACVDIFTPARVLQEHLPNRDLSMNLRHGGEGWIARLCDLLERCLQSDYRNDASVNNCIMKTLGALRATMLWIMGKAVSETQCVQHISKVLMTGIAPLQQAAVEALYSIFSRPNPQDEDVRDIVFPMLQPQNLGVLRELYAWASAGCVDLGNLDEEKYSLCKKLTELCSSLGTHVEQKPHLIPDGSDLAGFHNMLYEMLRSPSLVVSIPVLHTWTRALSSRAIRTSPTVLSLIGGLLETCSMRLVRYENLPEGAEDVTVQFLNEDIDTKPEKHAFLGNYRRYCVEVIESIVRSTPVEAINHILGQAESLIQAIAEEQRSFRVESFSKTSPSLLRFDAGLTVIDAALSGYLRWVASPGDDPQKHESERNSLQDKFEEFSSTVLRVEFKNPETLRKAIHQLGTFATNVLATRPDFALKLLEFILQVNMEDHPAHFEYTESVRDLQRTSYYYEIQRLGMRFPDHFMTVYSDLEQMAGRLLATQTADDGQKLGFQAFLFVIIHRTSALDVETKKTRLREMLNPAITAWHDQQFTDALSSFESFCNLLGFDKLGEFFASHNFHRIQDWAAQPLDAGGEELRSSILQRSRRMPTRLTRTLLSAATDRLDEESQTYEISRELWAEALPAILPNLLKLISQAHAFWNLQNWSHLPPELQSVIKRTLTDRFWQAGISTESKDDFFARVNSSKSTYEGFASTVRGSLRQIRETSYHTLCSLTKFGDAFYGIPDLPEPLSQTVFKDVDALSSHHLSVLLGMAQQLIHGCPPQHREHFLPPVISELFQSLTRKVKSEWDSIDQQISQKGADDNLGDEMKTESILRQLTYSAVQLVSQLLDFQRHEPTKRDPEPQQQHLSMWRFILATPRAFEPILMFCRAMIRVRDTRCCTNAVRLLRSALSMFPDKSPVRDFFCRELLQDAITSLHEPYFVDCQRDLAGFIAQVLLADPDTPRAIVLSLPGMASRAARVDAKLQRLREAAGDRQQRAVVLDLLSSVRGVSIHEQGKVERPPAKKPAVRDQYMAVEEAPKIKRGSSPGLAGVADMFG